MPSGVYRDPTLKETCRAKFGSDKPFLLGLFAVPLILGAAIGQTIKYELELRHQDQTQTNMKATQLWRENGYEVTGFKSYDVITLHDRSITLVLKNRADGKTYEGTALCHKSCAIRKIAAAGPASPN